MCVLNRPQTRVGNKCSYLKIYQDSRIAETSSAASLGRLLAVEEANGLCLIGASSGGNTKWPFCHLKRR